MLWLLALTTPGLFIGKSHDAILPDIGVDILPDEIRSLERSKDELSNIIANSAQPIKSNVPFKHARRWFGRHRSLSLEASLATPPPHPPIITHTRSAQLHLQPSPSPPEAPHLHFDTSVCGLPA